MLLQGKRSNQWAPYVFVKCFLHFAGISLGCTITSEWSGRKCVLAFSTGLLVQSFLIAFEGRSNRASSHICFDTSFSTCHRKSDSKLFNTACLRLEMVIRLKNCAWYNEMFTTRTQSRGFNTPWRGANKLPKQVLTLLRPFDQKTFQVSRMSNLMFLYVVVKTTQKRCFLLSPPVR